MSIPHSKKELYKDNVKLREMLDRAEASNAELVIVMEQQNKLINEINAKNAKINAQNLKEKGLNNDNSAKRRRRNYKSNERRVGTRASYATYNNRIRTT